MSKFAYKLRFLPPSGPPAAPPGPPAPLPSAIVPPVNGELFERVWEIVKECGEEERHFNQLQSVYRGVASTWLLATFAAVGYLLFNKDTRVSDPHYLYLMAATICLLGAIGISLIWVLDLGVYHRLLISAFEEGRKLENEFNWLPRIRSNMYRAEGPRRMIRKKLAFYYIGTAGVPLLGFCGFLSLNLKDFGLHWYRYAALAILGSAGWLVRLFWSTTKGSM